ncbi:MAG TPA: sugar phosphate isomerase/epimerase family protein, partial [Thermoguttaceae bacterium]|nr:sugar phosphate isomerase/epimerase family protein [Thermoguttaceae bacterium]
MTTRISRREMLAGTAAAGFCLSPMVRSLLAAEEKHVFKIGACDWSLGRHQNPEALDVAKEIGLDGVEVSFDGGDQFDLRDQQVRSLYRKKAEQSGLEIPSLAMGVLNRVPYATEPQTEQWVEDCVEVMAAMGVKAVLLAFFGKGNLKGRQDLQDEVIRRLKKVAPKAEKAGVILGVESTLDVDEHLRILDGVGSPAVQVYYDVANMTNGGYDVPAEIRRLGAQRICQIHMKENGCLLGKGKVDFPKIKEAVDEIGYRGWFILEGATE